MTATRETAFVPQSMRVAVMYDVDDIRIEERAVPALGAGDLLIRTAASGVCSGDLMPWYVRRKAPFVFGHEPAGTIVAIGEGAEPADEERARGGGPLDIGDRVFTHHHAPCMRCRACDRGAFVQCATWRSSRLDPGGMAEYYVVPRGNRIDTLRLPAHVDFRGGSLVEPLACVVKSLLRGFGDPRVPSLEPSAAVPGGAVPASRAEDRDADDGARWASRVPTHAPGLMGRTLFVAGAGVMGLMHVAVASAAGARVIVSDFHAGRRELALSLGAETAVDPSSAAEAVAERFGDGADVVVCGPGVPRVLEATARLVRPDGTFVMFTPIEPDERFAFDQSEAYFRDLRLVSSYSCGPSDTRRALRLIARGIVSPERLDATPYRFPDVAEAYRAMAAAEVVKAIVVFE